MSGSEAHRPAIELLEPVPAEVDAGADVAARVRVSCPHGCVLAGGRVDVMVAGEVVRTALLAVPDAPEPAAEADLVLEAPPRDGEAAWTIVFPFQEIGGNVHEEGALTVTATVVPHTTSVAVWDVPSPVRGSTFTVSVGIKCSALCALGGQLVGVYDPDGVRLGEGRLTDEPRAGTDGLYEGTVHLVAPDEPGVFACSVRFAAEQAGLPHAGASGDFTFRSVEVPRHTITVGVVPKGITAPLDGIEVRLGPYRAMTDERGTARVAVADGTYELRAWRVDIEPVSLEVEVAGDAAVEVDATPRRIVDEDEERMWM